MTLEPLIQPREGIYRTFFNSRVMIHLNLSRSWWGYAKDREYSPGITTRHYSLLILQPFRNTQGQIGLTLTAWRFKLMLGFTALNATEK